MANDYTNAKGETMTTATKTAKSLKTYCLCTRGYAGQEPQPRFTFTAVGDMDANYKASGWAQYQGHSFYTDEINASRSDVTVRLAVGNELEWETHNEWVRK